MPSLLPNRHARRMEFLNPKPLTDAEMLHGHACWQKILRVAGGLLTGPGLWRECVKSILSVRRWHSSDGGSGPRR